MNIAGKAESRPAGRWAYCLMVAAALAGLAGCATQVAHLDSKVQGRPRGGSSTYKCSVGVASIVDARNRTDDMGEMALAKVTIEDIVSWVESGFTAINIPRGEPQESPRLVLRTEIKIASIRSITMAKATNVVLAVSYDDGAKQYYRGDDTGVNWNGSASEIKSAFDRALLVAMQQIRTDVSRKCNEARQTAAAPPQP